jgi:hypothetical protein
LSGETSGFPGPSCRRICPLCEPTAVHSPNSLCLPVPLSRPLSPTFAYCRLLLSETLNSMSPPTTDVRAIAAAALDLSSAAQGHHVSIITPPSFVLPPLESRSIPAPTSNNRLPRLPPLNSVFFPWSPIQAQEHQPYLLQQSAVSTGARIPPPGYPEPALHPHLLLHPPVPTPAPAPAPLPRSRHWPSEPAQPSQHAPNVNKQYAETVCDRIYK